MIALSFWFCSIAYHAASSSVHVSQLGSSALYELVWRLFAQPESSGCIVYSSRFYLHISHQLFETRVFRSPTKGGFYSDELHSFVKKKLKRLERT